MDDDRKVTQYERRVGTSTQRDYHRSQRYVEYAVGGCSKQSPTLADTGKSSELQIEGGGYRERSVDTKQ